MKCLKRVGVAVSLGRARVPVGDGVACGVCGVGGPGRVARAARRAVVYRCLVWVFPRRFGLLNR